ncbi:MAG: hypothetical protein R2850_13090 [Bacteroidia bacterium]
MINDEVSRTFTLTADSSIAKEQGIFSSPNQIKFIKIQHTGWQRLEYGCDGINWVVKNTHPPERR